MHERQGCDRFRLLQRQGIAKAAPEKAYSVRNMRMEVVPRGYARLLDFERNERTGFLFGTKAGYCLTAAFACDANVCSGVYFLAERRAGRSATDRNILYSGGRDEQRQILHDNSDRLCIG